MPIPSASPSSEGEGRSLLASSPVPVRHRDDGWTAERQRAFLEELAASGRVCTAARAVGMSRESAYALRRRPDARAFAQAWDAARALAVEHLTEVAWDRALDGEVRSVFYHGDLVGETRHFDNRLLLALIAQNRAVLAAGRSAPALASPELVAEVAADWPAALARVGSGEALVEPGSVADEALSEDALEPEIDAHGTAMGEAQQLSIGCYAHWWDEEEKRWLTNWPAPEDFTGEELWVDDCGEALGSYDPESPAEDKYGLPVGREWARTLSPEERAGLEASKEAIAEHRARRVELYRRAAFGLAGRAVVASLAAANGGRFIPRQSLRERTL